MNLEIGTVLGTMNRRRALRGRDGKGFQGPPANTHLGPAWSMTILIARTSIGSTRPRRPSFIREVKVLASLGPSQYRRAAHGF